MAGSRFFFDEPQNESLPLDSSALRRFIATFLVIPQFSTLTPPRKGPIAFGRSDIDWPEIDSSNDGKHNFQIWFYDVNYIGIDTQFRFYGLT